MKLRSFLALSATLLLASAGFAFPIPEAGCTQQPRDAGVQASAGFTQPAVSAKYAAMEITAGTYGAYVAFEAMALSGSSDEYPLKVLFGATSGLMSGTTTVTLHSAGGSATTVVKTGALASEPASEVPVLTTTDNVSRSIARHPSFYVPAGGVVLVWIGTTNKSVQFNAYITEPSP